jgi:hypothetical protein
VTFGSKLEAAKYFSDKFAGVRDVDHNAGLWAWLALRYFDQLCPPDPSGKREVREDARYIPGTGWRRYYRHLLAAPYRVYRSHGDNAKLLLLDPVDKLGDIWEQLASRQEIITNLGILGTATLLYLDTKKDRPKRGAASTKRKARHAPPICGFDPATRPYLRPLLDAASDILGLLPGGFDGWRPPDAASQAA